MPCKFVKVIFTCSIVLLCGIFLNGAEVLIVDSKISEVTVYPDGALVTRSATVQPAPGQYTVVFANIVPDIDENSLKVSAAGEAVVKLLGAKVKKEFLEGNPSEKIERLKNEIQKINDAMVEQENAKSVLQEEKRFLNSIQLFSQGQIPQELVTKMPSAQELDNTLKFLGGKLKENYDGMMIAELKIRELNKKLDVLKRELSYISGTTQKMKRTISVELEVKKQGALILAVSYLARGASWQPLYEARTNFDTSEVELVSYGVIRQNTGEDWDDVAVSLSTGKPTTGGRMPYVAPWFIRPFEPRVISSMRKSLRSDSAVEFQQEAFAGALAPEEKNKEEEVQIEDKGIALLYKLPRKATVKADGQEYKLPVSTQILNTKFEYSGYPRVSLLSYIGGRVRNSPQQQLLSGRVNVFLNGDYVGVSGIDNVAPGEEFDLYLGADENVKVKRECLEKKVDTTFIGNIPSSTKETVYKYKLTVENYKTQKITVKLFEAMPVSEDDRIKVKITNVSQDPKVKDWQDRKGVWLWEMEIEPKGKREIFYTFTIEHPRTLHIEGL